jgi:hypothetical protein
MLSFQFLFFIAFTSHISWHRIILIDRKPFRFYTWNEMFRYRCIPVYRSSVLLFYKYLILYAYINFFSFKYNLTVVKKSIKTQMQGSWAGLRTNMGLFSTLLGSIHLSQSHPQRIPPAAYTSQSSPQHQKCLDSDDGDWRERSGEGKEIYIYCLGPWSSRPSAARDSGRLPLPPLHSLLCSTPRLPTVR